MEYGSSSGAFMIKNYNDVLKESSFATTEFLEDIYDTTRCPANEDILSSNICHISSQNVSYIDSFPFFIIFLQYVILSNSFIN